MNALDWVVICILYTIANIFRLKRWNYLQKSILMYPTTSGVISYSFGRVLNFILPYKIGDFVRVFTLTDFRNQLLPIILLLAVERVCDLVAVLAIAAVLQLSIKVSLVYFLIAASLAVSLLLTSASLGRMLTRKSSFQILVWSIKRLASRRILFISAIYTAGSFLLIIFANFLFISELHSKTKISDLIAIQFFTSNWINTTFPLPVISVLVTSWILVLLMVFFSRHIRRFVEIEDKDSKIEDLAGFALFEISVKGLRNKVELKSNEKIVKFLPGGSDAITYLYRRDGFYYVRKIARGDGKRVLENQYQYLSNVKGRLSFPLIYSENPNSKYFSYSMEYFSEHKTLISYLGHSHNPSKVFRDLFDHYSSTFNFVDDSFDQNIRHYYSQKRDRAALHLKKFEVGRADFLNLAITFQSLISRCDKLFNHQDFQEERTYSHGDFSSSNILYDGQTFKYIDLLKPESYSSRDCDWAKLFLTLLIGLESRAYFLNGVDYLDKGRSSLHDSDIALALEMIENLGNGVELDRLTCHAAIHLLRILPYKVKDNVSAKYWLHLSHHCLDFLTSLK